MSFSEFQYAFTNGLPLAKHQAAHESITVPESRVVVRQGLTALALVSFGHLAGTRSR